MLVSCSHCGKSISARATLCPFCRTATGVPKAATGRPQPKGASAVGPADLDSVIASIKVIASQAAPSPEPPPGAPVAAPRASPALSPIEVPAALPAYRRGDFVGDLLQVIDTLGEGGFGIVYLARSLASNAIVALKTLRGELLRDAQTRALFEKEARIWIDLGTHPNLVRAKWVDEIGGRLYIAMEYVQAGAGRPNSLEGHLAKGPIDPEQALLWAIQFCRGMEYAVSRGVRCHRDIKPANILIGSDSVVKISDFGIAGLALVPEAPGGGEATMPSASASADPAKTRVGTVFGTPTHMSPEQFVDAASCDERSDIYSFGVVLYQMASGGRLPFLPPPPPKAMAAQAGAYYWHAFRTLHTSMRAAPLTSPLSRVIERALQKTPEDRYPAFASLRADLEALYEKSKGAKAPVLAAGGESSNDWNNRGVSLATLNRWAEAVACYDKSLAIDPDSAAVHNNRGNALRNLGRVDEAIADLDRAIALDPLYAAAWENKALLYASARRDEDALTCIERSLALDPTPADAWVIKGVMLGRLNRREEELRAFDGALRADPRNVSAWFNKANALSSANPSLALDCVNQALACDPGYVSGWDLKGTLLAESGRAAEAVACHQEAVRLAPRDGRLAYNLGNSWSAIGRLEEARSAYEDATRMAPEMSLTWYNLALATFRLGRVPEAIRLFEYFLSLNPPDDGLRRTAERLTSEVKAGRTPTLGAISIGDRVSSEAMATVSADALPRVEEPLAAVSEVAVPRPASEATPLAVRTPPPPLEEPLPPPRPSLDALNKEATAHFNAGRFAESMSVVERILQLDPRDEYALNTLANALYKLGRKDEACATAQRLIEASPGEPMFWVNKALIEKGAGRLKEAGRSAIDLVEIAQARGQTGKPVEQGRGLLSELQKMGIAPNARSHTGWLGLGFASMLAGRAQAGLDFFDKAVESAPDNVEARRWKGHALKEMKRADDALAVYDGALALAPDDPEIHHDRGVVLAMLREFSPAVEAFDQALARDPNHVASLSDKGKYAGELGRHEVALAALRRAAALVPDHPAPWLNMALVEDILKRDEEALLSFERFLERAKPEMRLQIESSKRRVEQLRARVAARKGVPIQKSSTPPPSPAVPNQAPPSDDEAWMRTIDGFLAGETPDNLSEEELARLATALGGDQSLLEMLQSSLEGATARPKEAPSAEPAPAPAPPPPGPPPARPTGNPVAKKWAEQGRALLAAGRPVEALAALEKATERDPNEALYWADRGSVLKALSRHDRARDAWTRALVLNGGCVPALMGLASAERRAGRHAEAIKLLMQAAGLEPENSEAWFQLGDSYSQTSDWPHAHAAFSLCLQGSPRNAMALSGLGEAALNLDRPDEALSALEAALTLDDSIATAWFLRGALLSKKGRVEEAAQSQRRAVELDPTRSSAWFNLSINLRELKRYPEALEAVNRALQIRPDFAFALSGKGLTLHALRRFEEAVAAFDLAVAADGASPWTWTHRGKSLLSLKRNEAALDSFVRALSIQPDHTLALEGRAAALAALESAKAARTREEARAQAASTPGALVLPEVTVPQTAARASQDECLKRSEMARNQALFDRALEWADQAIAADPRQYNAWASKAEALFGLKRFAEAAAHAEKVTVMNPKFVLAWARLASSYEGLDALDHALGAWDKTVELAPRNVLYWNGRGGCLAKMARFEEALSCHEQALAIDPRFSYAKYYKGQMEARLGKREDAIKSFQQFLALAPPNLSALIQDARERIQELKA